MALPVALARTANHLLIQRSLGTSVHLDHQAASVGYRVPVKAQLKAAFSGASLQNCIVRFFAVPPDGGEPIEIGSSHPNAKGEATAYFAPDHAGKWLTYCVLEGATRESHEHGSITVLPQNMPTVVLDANWMIAQKGLDGFAADVSQLSPRFRYIALVDNKKTRDKILALGIAVTPLINDYTSSPFSGTKRGFDEAQLEKIKRLKFESGIPIVGVVGRQISWTSGYDASGVYPMVPDVSGWQSALQDGCVHDALVTNFQNYQVAVKKPREEFFWDGLTQSTWIYGNHVNFFTENKDAASELYHLIDGARTFLNIASFGMQSDAFGRRAFEKMKSACERGVAMKAIIDAMCQAPFPTERGFSWLDLADIRRLFAAGAKIAFHDLFDHVPGDKPHRGPLSRRHRKIMTLDYTNDNAAPEILAYGGGRLVAGLSNEDVKYPSDTPFSLMGIGWGNYRDMSFTVRGPAANAANDKFLADFAWYTGQDQSAAKRAAPPPVVAGTTALRYITHDSLRDQNTYNVLMNFLTDPDSDNITFVNSFYPTDEVILATEAATRNGKKIKFITSGFWWQHANRAALAPRLIRAGVELIVIPGQLHTKLYANGKYFAFGNHNVDVFSQYDAEDLFVMPRDNGADAAKLERYLKNLELSGVRVNDFFDAESDPALIRDFVDAIRDDREPTNDAFQEHGLLAAIAHGIRFALTEPFRHGQR